MDLSRLNFDHLLVERRPGSFNIMDVREFAEMTVSERFELVLDRKVKFMDGDEVVPVNNAMKCLVDVIAEDAPPTAV